MTLTPHKLPRRRGARAITSCRLLLYVLSFGVMGMASCGSQEVDAITVRVPEGFRAKDGTKPEPHTNTGWAHEVVHEETGIEMVFIPAGEFQMGSPASERDQSIQGRPVHTVRITRPFYVGKYEVTQEEWRKVMGSNPSVFKGERKPVHYVSWNACQEFLSKAGDGLRLPTEAEWEYACRAGTTTAFSFAGDASDLGRYAWYKGNSARNVHPVGGKLPNPWGLYDMHGNVLEWCADWHDSHYYSRSPRDDPQGPSSGSVRVLRGGALGDPPEHCRSFFRWAGRPDSGTDGGFRVVRGL